MSDPARARVQHALDRRVRLRVPALAGLREACANVAERLAKELPDMAIAVSPRTGSILIEIDAGGPLDPEDLRARVERHAGSERAEAGQPPDEFHPERHPGPTHVARAVARAFTEINGDIRAALDHRADLGTVLPVLFAAGGLIEVAVTGKLPPPAWFNLLWWSIRSFVTFNASAVEEEGQRAKGEGEGSQ